MCRSKIRLAPHANSKVQQLIFPRHNRYTARMSMPHFWNMQRCLWLKKKKWAEGSTTLCRSCRNNDVSISRTHLWQLQITCNIVLLVLLCKFMLRLVLSHPWHKRISSNTHLRSVYMSQHKKFQCKFQLPNCAPLAATIVIFIKERKTPLLHVNWFLGA